jgi:isopentenyl-diphosphate delta-isomerase
MKEEPVDILDEQGNKTGQTMMKSEAHRRGLWHGGAHLWIINSKGEILLQLRAPNKVIHPNVWDVSVAGHIPAGKKPLETLVEETKEELGLEVRREDIKFVDTKHTDEPMDSGKWRHRIFLTTYAVTADLDLSKLKLEVGELSDVRWVSPDELENDLSNPQKSKKYTGHNYIYRTGIDYARRKTSY